jgi:hypothetical protein
MTIDDREFWRATDDWLEAGSDRTPPDAIDGVLLAIRTTRQERALPRPVRPTTMTLLSRVAIAAVAVVAIAFAWTRLAPSQAGVGGIATPSPSPSPIVTPSPTPTPVPISSKNSTPGDPLQAGVRYATTADFPVRLSFVAPPGWVANIGGLFAVWTGPAATGDNVSFQRSMTVNLNPCNLASGTVPLGTSASDLVNAIVSRPGLAPNPPTSTTLGGQPATLLRLALDRTRACPGGTAPYTLWQLPGGATNPMEVDMSERVWVVDTTAGPLVVLAVDRPYELPAVQQLLDSIEINP